MTDAEQKQADESFAESRPQAYRYASLLRIGVRVVLAMLVATYVIYLTAIVPPHKAPADLPAEWGKPVTQFVKDTGLPAGWQWAGRLGESDVLAILPAIVLVSLSAVCLLAIVPVFIRQKEPAYVIIVILQVALIVVAALL